MIVAIALMLLALAWLPLTAGAMIVGACCALWLVDQMFGASITGAPRGKP